MLTIHDCDYTVLATLIVHVVMAQLTSRPANITALACHFTGNVSGMQGERNIAECCRKGDEELSSCGFGFRISLFHGKVDLETETVSVLLQNFQEGQMEILY